MEIQKSTGETEKFDADKLCQSIENSGASSDMAKQVCAVVEKRMTPGVTTTKIFREAMRNLLKEDMTIAVNYGLRRAIDDMGPAGFLFEQYVEALMQAHGYKTKRNEYMQGNCIEHEVDVLATKGKMKCLVEAKYKNQHNLKTHIDVVMYADARLIDIAGKHEKKKEDFGTHEMWIITNTKFTQKSIKYGRCRKMKLIGWNYPTRGNLQDMIVSKKVYPITSLPSVSQFEREKFAEREMILAQDVLPYSQDDLIQDFDIPPEIARKIIDEAKSLVK